MSQEQIYPPVFLEGLSAGPVEDLPAVRLAGLTPL